MRKLFVVSFLLLVTVFPVAADDWTDLRAAIYYQWDAEVVSLLESGVDVNMIGPDGWTPLMIAADQGDVHMVQYLLDKGADPTIKKDDGRTAFDLTSSSQVKRLVRVPVEDPLGRNRPVGKQGMAPAEEPRSTGLPPVVGGVQDQQLWSDARWNIEYNQMDELARVLDQERLDINMRGRDGWTLLMTAAWSGKPAAVGYLLSRGADPTLANDKGQTAIDMSTSDAVLHAFAQVGVKPKPAPQILPEGSDLAYCKKLGGQAYLLCDSGDLSCRVGALNDQQQCEATGVWP